MLNVTNVTATNRSAATYSTGPAVLAGGSATEYCFAFVATARDATQSLGGPLGNKYTASTRSATTCFMVGLKETIEIQNADGVPWQWRRICFTLKSTEQLLPPNTTTAQFVFEDSAGYKRPITEVPASLRAQLYGVLFAGTQGSDWIDPLTAKTDTAMVSVKFDRTKTISSGNDEGFIRKYPRWHPMRHNLVYADEEAGGAESGNRYSTRSKAGMGDYIVIDIVRPRAGSASANQLLWNVQSTLYWHER